MVGFGLYGSIHGPTEYTVNIQASTLGTLMIKVIAKNKK